MLNNAASQAEDWTCQRQTQKERRVELGKDLLAGRNTHVPVTLQTALRAEPQIQLFTHAQLQKLLLGLSTTYLPSGASVQLTSLLPADPSPSTQLPMSLPEPYTLRVYSFNQCLSNTSQVLT